MPYLILIITLALIIFAHLLSFDFLVRIFNIKKQSTKSLVFAFILFGLVSFILSAILVRANFNLLTRAYYILAGISLGFILNLFWGVVLFHTLRFVFKKYLNPQLILITGRFILFTVIIITIISFYQSYHPVITTVPIKIKNLSPEWQNKKIVQISDLHLGALMGKKELEKIIEKINNLKPDIVVITGDFFDGMSNGKEDCAVSLKKIKSKNGVYFIHGNHELYTGMKEVEEKLSRSDVQVLNDMLVDLGDLQILGLAYPNFGETKDLEKIIKDNSEYNPNKTNILLYHAPTNTVSLNNNGHSDIYLNRNTNFSNMDKLGIDLQLSGHSHRGQFWPFNLVTKYIYNGFDYGLHKVGNFQIYTSSGAGVWGPSLRNVSRSEIVEIILR